MFQKIKNLDTAFRQLRSFTLFVVLVCAAVAGCALFFSYRIASQAQQKVFVLHNGKAIEAFAASVKDNIPVEAKDHVRVFHEKFFTLDPDESAIESNIKKALYLSDATARELYQNLREKGYYASIISGNVSQDLQVDSVSVSLDSYPYPFTCYARQVITRPASIVTRLLITQGALRNVSRTDHNPHGFLIEKWKTIENRDVQVQER
jgi:conjugative transposon TraK protein